MKKSGVFNLITDGGERKMHYIVKEDKIITTTAQDTNKIKQIKANPEVKTDLDDAVYIANLIEGDEAKVEVKNYRKELNFLNRAINKFMGAKDPVVIVLEKKI